MFAKEGYPNIAAGTFIAALLFVIAFSIPTPWAYILYGLSVFVIVFLLFFFRDPDRSIPVKENVILAPADGKIVSLKEVEEPVYIEGKAIQISIFLSLLDVHVNRLPASGIVEYLKYNPGTYLMAWDHRASSLNERADFGVRHPSGIKVFFRQITGFLARRIVYHLEEGDEVEAGERFGMMKFGSRMDILVPPEVDIHVKEGDRTVGGETILAHIDSKD
ncbi:MAG TPA: phosphatidylserine decarboxylase family protein [Balneolaceae bacterium]|nr:phosphatidylserine decarboxylase family protein [Balneolaceae bacterium]